MFMNEIECKLWNHFFQPSKEVDAAAALCHCPWERRDSEGGEGRYWHLPTDSLTLTDRTMQPARITAR